MGGHPQMSEWMAIHALPHQLFLAVDLYVKPGCGGGTAVFRLQGSLVVKVVEGVSYGNGLAGGDGACRRPTTGRTAADGGRA